MLGHSISTRNKKSDSYCTKNTYNNPQKHLRGYNNTSLTILKKVINKNSEKINERCNSYNGRNDSSVMSDDRLKIHSSERKQPFSNTIQEAFGETNFTKKGPIMSNTSPREKNTQNFSFRHKNDSILKSTKSLRTVPEKPSDGKSCDNNRSQNYKQYLIYNSVNGCENLNSGLNKKKADLGIENEVVCNNKFAQHITRKKFGNFSNKLLNMVDKLQSNSKDEKFFNLKNCKKYYLEKDTLSQRKKNNPILFNKRFASANNTPEKLTKNQNQLKSNYNYLHISTNSIERVNTKYYKENKHRNYKQNGITLDAYNTAINNTPLISPSKFIPKNYTKLSLNENIFSKVLNDNTFTKNTNKQTLKKNTSDDPINYDINQNLQSHIKNVYKPNESDFFRNEQKVCGSELKTGSLLDKSKFFGLKSKKHVQERKESEKTLKSPLDKDFTMRVSAIKNFTPKANKYNGNISYQTNSEIEQDQKVLQNMQKRYYKTPNVSSRNNIQIYPQNALEDINNSYETQNNQYLEKTIQTSEKFKDWYKSNTQESFYKSRINIFKNSIANNADECPLKQKEPSLINIKKINKNPKSNCIIYNTPQNSNQKMKFDQFQQKFIRNDNKGFDLKTYTDFIKTQSVTNRKLIGGYSTPKICDSGRKECNAKSLYDKNVNYFENSENFKKKSSEQKVDFQDKSGILKYHEQDKNSKTNSKNKELSGIINEIKKMNKYYTGKIKSNSRVNYLNSSNTFSNNFVNNSIETIKKVGNCTKCSDSKKNINFAKSSYTDITKNESQKNQPVVFLESNKYKRKHIPLNEEATLVKSLNFETIKQKLKKTKDLSMCESEKILDIDKMSKNQLLNLRNLINKKITNFEEFSSKEIDSKSQEKTESQDCKPESIISDSKNEFFERKNEFIEPKNICKSIQLKAETPEKSHEKMVSDEDRLEMQLNFIKDQNFVFKLTENSCNDNVDYNLTLTEVDKKSHFKDIEEFQSSIKKLDISESFKITSEFIKNRNLNEEFNMLSKNVSFEYSEKKQMCFSNSFEKFILGRNFLSLSKKKISFKEVDTVTDTTLDIIRQKIQRRKEQLPESLKNLKETQHYSQNYLQPTHTLINTENTKESTKNGLFKPEIEESQEILIDSNYLQNQLKIEENYGPDKINQTLLTTSKKNSISLNEFERNSNTLIETDPSLQEIKLGIEQFKKQIGSFDLDKSLFMKNFENGNLFNMFNIDESRNNLTVDISL